MRAGLCLAQKPVFESASVKMAEMNAPMSGGGGCSMTGPSRDVRFSNAPMMRLLMQAYGVEHMDEISGPDWLRDVLSPTRYEVTAVAPAGTTKEQCEAMLRNLLVARFHLVAHHEMRKFPGYDLVVAAGGPKLKKASAESLASPGVSQDLGKDPKRLVYRAQTGLASFVHDLPFLMGGEPHSQVTDKTGLNGVYDFTLEYSDDLDRAMETELGLKLVKSADADGDTVVVDSVDKTPTPN